jgi:hypothetical protein
MVCRLLLWYSTFVDPTWVENDTQIQLSFPSENEQQVYRTLWCYAIPLWLRARGMHFQCLNGFQLVSPPMRTVVGKPYVSKAFSVVGGYGPNVRPILHLGPFRNHQFINGLSLPCGGKVSTVGNWVRSIVVGSRISLPASVYFTL